MNQGTSQEPVRCLKPWHYGLLMFAFYLFWGSFFTEISIASQIIFNFAVFYPAGFTAGYFRTRSRLRDVYIIGLLFNSLTYGLAITGGQMVQLPIMLIDFLSMVLWIFLGILVGKRTAA
ncbi:hypothetical protein [Desulfitobacterium sp. AusDCA]|uniref:hypothetical protein n=1 Tax=Desulfitobacterium sp. AusDCA TaxID=3240383 RepID=UPI003DA7695A